MKLSLILKLLAFSQISTTYSIVISPTFSNVTHDIYDMSFYNTVGEINCDKDVCHIICDESSSCKYIRPSVQNSLIISCNADKACSDAIFNVKLLGLHASTTINCKNTNISNSTTTSSCYNAEFNIVSTASYDHNNSTTSIICGPYDCYYAQFNLNDIAHTIVDCGFTNSCSYADLRLLAIETVNILCNGSGSCYYADLQLLAIETVDILCNGSRSCYYADLRLLAIGTVDILCNGSRSCYYFSTDIELLDDTSVNVQCIDTSNVYRRSMEPCYYSHFNVYSSDSNNNTVFTATSYGSDVYFNITNVGDATIHCNEQYSCSRMDLIATSTGMLDLRCNNKYSCQYANIYCPYHDEHACNIECGDYDYNCYGMRIFVNDEYAPNYLDLQCPQMLKGNNKVSQVCDSIGFYCNESFSKLLWYGSSWDCNSYHCCPLISGTYTCPSNEPCNINCTGSDCGDYLIDATAASSLRLNCSTGLNYGCQGARIKCPNGFASTCDIYCEEEGSCQSTSIQVSYNSSVATVNCNAPYSCQYMDLRASSTERLYVSCNGNYSCYYSNIYCPYHEKRVCNIKCGDNNRDCYGMDILVNDDYVYNYLDLQCPTILNDNNIGQVCYDINVYCSADRSTTGLNNNATGCYQSSPSYCCPFRQKATIKCNSNEPCLIDCSERDCGYETIDALNATSLDLICSNGYDCHNTVVYCPWHQLQCNINCLASYACYYIQIEAQNTYQVNITATITHAWYYGVLDASNAQNVDITCLEQINYHTMTNIDSSCYNGNWYLPDYGHNTSITCYGEGCGHFGNIYVENSVSSLTWNVYGCIQECISYSTCYRCDDDDRLYCSDLEVNIDCGTDEIQYLYVFDDCGYVGYGGDCGCGNMSWNGNGNEMNESCITTTQYIDDSSTLPMGTGEFVAVVCGSIILMIFFIVILRRYCKSNRVKHVSKTTENVISNTVQMAVPAKAVTDEQQQQPLQTRNEAKGYVEVSTNDNGVNDDEIQ